jgi:hypothetical protein
MQVLYLPCFNDVDELSYEFSGDIITATLNGEVDVFDFTDMPDGFASAAIKRGEIQTTLPVAVVTEAEKQGGVLQVKLVRFIGRDATYEERFPDWIEV